MRRLSLLVALTLTACGGSSTESTPAPVDAPPEWKSGTRLRAQVLDGGEGATLFLGFFDTKFATACFFGTSTDGKTRCLPEVLDFQVRYADARCTEQIASVSPCPGLKWVSVDEGTGCEGSRYAVRPIGKPFVNDVMTPVYSVDAHGACAQTGEVTGESLFHVGPAAPESELVEASAAQVPIADGPVGLRRLVAEDGAEETIGFFDRASGVDCGPSGIVGIDTCVPTISSYGYRNLPGYSFYSDAACMKEAPVALVDGSPECPLPAGEFAIVGGPQGTCQPWSEELRRVGKRVRAADFFVKDAEGQCGPAMHFSVPLVELGDVVSADAFPAMPRQVDRGTGRLRVKAYGGANDESLFATSGFLDGDAKRAECSPQLVDALRCAPPWSGSAGFGDASCSEPVAARPRQPDCPATTLDVVLAPIGPVEACTAQHHRSFSRGAELDLTSVYLDDSGTCTEFPADPGNRYEKLTPLDASGWAKVTATTE